MPRGCVRERVKPSAPLLGDTVEATLQDLLQQLPAVPPPSGQPGRPPEVAACVLWAGLLVCVLRGFAAQRSLWQLLTLKGLWHFPRVAVTSQAIYQRLARSTPDTLQTFFLQITALLQARYAAVSDVAVAPFATDILALDHSILDALLRKLKVLRGLPRTDPRLMPGQLGALFDVRRQLWRAVRFWPDAQRNEKLEVEQWLEGLLPGTLLLFDLGFFAFRWFDTLTARGFYFVSRQRAKISVQVLHTCFDGVAGPVHLRDQLVYLGKYRADRAAHPVRLLEIRRGNATYRYLTNVLDPELLPAAHVVELYRRRWDIEQAFHLLKTHLNLFLLWSGHANVVQLQVFATLILSQVVLSLRTEVALAARVPLRDVSLPLLLRWLPELAAGEEDPVQVLACRGRLAGILRPFRGREYHLPPTQGLAYVPVPTRPPPRRARYAGKRSTVGSSVPAGHRGQRKHGWGLRPRRLRQK